MWDTCDTRLVEVSCGSFDALHKISEIIVSITAVMKQIVKLYGSPGKIFHS